MAAAPEPYREPGWPDEERIGEEEITEAAQSFCQRMPGVSQRITELVGGDQAGDG